MNTRILVTALIMAVVALTACQGAVGTQQAGGDASLEGTQWVLATLNGQAPIEGTMPTAAFAENQVGGSAGCNQYSGSYVASSGNLTIREIAMTEMYCMEPEGVTEQEQSFLSALASAAGYRVTDGRLEILDPDGHATLTFMPPPPLPEAALENTTWSLTTFVEGEIATSLVNGTAITLRLAGGEVSGSAGCNSYGGSYAVQQSTLHITDVVITQKGCPEPAGIMEQEARYTDILRNVATFALDANQLTLSTPDGRGLLFTAQP